MSKKLEIGTFVCDMHYGLPTCIGYSWEGGPKIACSNHTVVECRDNASDIVNTLLSSVGCNKLSTNKEAVIVGKNWNGDGRYVAAYSYDNTRFGLFYFQEEECEICKGLGWVEEPYCRLCHNKIEHG